MTCIQSLRKHWPEYLMEAWGLGLFMVAAGSAVMIVESPIATLSKWLPEGALARRALIGLAMGLTAITVIYSPWGKRSGAHINPAVTLSFLRLGKIAAWDAFFYIVFQFIGGTLGILLAAFLFGDSFKLPPVSWLTTMPGTQGSWIAFVAETAVAFSLMLTLLFFMNRKRLEHYTGMAAGILVAVFITFEAPLSGMSINPARSFASALPSGLWTSFWVYLTAPLLGMLSAVETYRLLKFSHTRMCAKLIHVRTLPCIHCGHDPKRTINYNSLLRNPNGQTTLRRYHHWFWSRRLRLRL